MSMFFGILLLCYALVHGYNSLLNAKHYKNGMLALRTTVLAATIYFGLKLTNIL